MFITGRVYDVFIAGRVYAVFIVYYVFIVLYVSQRLVRLRFRVHQMMAWCQQAASVGVFLKSRVCHFHACSYVFIRVHTCVVRVYYVCSTCVLRVQYVCTTCAVRVYYVSHKLVRLECRVYTK